MDVAVLGAGYAGVAATRRLEVTLPDAVDLCLVDDTGIHEIQHEIHRVIRFPELADELRIPVADVVDRAATRDGVVTSVDPDTGRIETLAGDPLTPDYVIVSLGSVTADYGIPGVAEYGQSCKSVEDAAAIRNRALASPSGARMVVAGAGLTGIQVAGELAASEADVHVTLLEQESRVAPRFPSAFAEAIRRALDRAGVEVRTDATISRVGADELELAGREQITYAELVWTGGIRGPDAISGERWRVDADLRAGRRAFVAGDAAAATDDRGEPVPAAAQTAVRQGWVAANNVSRLVRGNDGGLVFEPRLDRYRYQPPGWFVTVGDATVGMLGDRVLTGAAAEAAKTTVGTGYLTSIGAVDTALRRVRRTIGLGTADRSGDDPGGTNRCD